MSARKAKSTGGPVGGILSGIVGGGLFLLLWLALGVPVLLSLVVGVVGYGAGLLIFRRSARGVEVAIPGVSRAMLEEALREGADKLAELKSLSGRIPDRPVREKFDAIVTAAGSIIDDLRKNPKDIRAARQFLSYYLDATVKIVSRYTELAAKKLDSADIQGSLRKVESMLDTIRGAFEKQHARLLENDVLDLDSELALLKQTISMEGLGEEAKKE